ncbi:unnamed protein product [Polarella glacialis]|uniref:Probable beta-glucosidase G n=1 Tax=Polarella glacialis TaxID=89957 RepID=A0A813FIS0_POLGL|nr:unnamed protein product [Polarella glacialis]
MQEGAGIAAVVKHFVLNQQETNRRTVDSHVDEQTLWELYYPPFQAAVGAGVAAVMCSYNFANGKQACENAQTLTVDLKERMGFKGWVMSDWWAFGSGNGAAAGADQDMPGTDGYFTAAALSNLPGGRLEDMAARVLSGLAHGGSFRPAALPGCRAGCDCEDLLYNVNATSAEHVALARSLAAESAILLKNTFVEASGREVLPLRAGQTVAVLGSACAARGVQFPEAADWTAADYYVVGGSGRVLSQKVVSVLEGLSGRGLLLQASTSESIPNAAKVLQAAEVAIICGGATTSESFDRRNLRLDQEEFIVTALSLAGNLGVPAVVVALAPGAITTPWKDNATAALLLFLSGQETGNAAADVLLGTVGPSGRLPVTLPLQEEDAVPPCDGTSLCIYEEQLKGGWHIYDGKSVAFPFGHGLSYTKFDYAVINDRPRLRDGNPLATLTIRVRNVGTTFGVEVPQMYVRFPASESKVDRRMQLRGFQKSPKLAPGEGHDFRFALAPRDLSVWDTEHHNWKVVAGRFQVFLGASSRDLRLCGKFEDGAGQSMRPCCTDSRSSLAGYAARCRSWPV